MIYLLKMELKSEVLYKIGFTSDSTTKKRFRSYGTENPAAICLQTIRTYNKTKRSLENAIHAEIRKQGYSFTEAAINGSLTEWYAMSYEQAKVFEQNGGLATFKACKGRKIETYTVGQ